MVAWRRLCGIVAAAVVVLAGLTLVPQTMTAAPAEAADASAWNAGYIVSDDNFYAGDAMDVNAVQAFLNSQNTCGSGSNCIANFRQSTPSIAADQYCSGYAGRANETAASIIARVGASCNISQKALIVLLQKEQGLITSSNPSSYALTHATGFSCPDTAPCDPAYSGVFYQLYYGARQFQVYRQHPTWYNYQPFAWNNILWSPNACGSGPVYIQNYATAGLYDYTPYQPNAAALANLYGTGDACSTYGNRNFWRLWTDWFGDPTAPVTAMIQVQGHPELTYLVNGNVRYGFVPGSKIKDQYAVLGAPKIVSVDDFYANYTDGPPVKQAIRSTDGSYFLVDQSKKFRFQSCDQVRDFGYPCDGDNVDAARVLPTLPSQILARIPDGGWVQNTVRDPAGTIWLMQSGQRRQVLDTGLVAAYGYSRTPVALSALAVESVQDYSPRGVGVPAVASGLYTDGSGKYTALTGSGAFTLPASMNSAAKAGAKRLLPASLAALAPAASLPPRMHAGTYGGFYVLTSGGWLQVSWAQYGGFLWFPTYSDDMANVLPVVGSATTPQFVKQASDNHVTLISGGYQQALAPGGDWQWLARYYGLPVVLWTLADGALAGLDKTTTFTDPGVFRLGDNTPYIIDGGKRYLAAGGCAQVADFGRSCDALEPTPNTQRDSLPDGGTLSSLVALPDGSTWLMQNGTRRQVVDTAVTAAYGLPLTGQPHQNALLASVPVGEPVLAAGVYTDGAGHYRVASYGGNYDLPAVLSGTVLVKNAKVLQPASFAALKSRGELPVRIISGINAFVLTTSGWLRVNTAQYGGNSAFTVVPAGSEGGLPSVGVQGGPHFVQSSASPQMYLLSSGQLQPVASAAARSWLAAYYGLTDRTWIVLDNVLKGLKR